MTHALLAATHLAGATVLGVAIAGLWIVDGRARRTSDLVTFVRMRQRMARIERGVLLPSVLMLLASGVWLVAQSWGLRSVVQVPWLAGMVALFVFQSAWAQVVARPHGLRLERLAAQAQPTGKISSGLDAARHSFVPTFGRYVEPLVYLLLMGFGALRPMTWVTVLAGIATAGLAAAVCAALASGSDALLRAGELPQ